MAKLGATTALATGTAAPVSSPQLRVYPNPTAGAGVDIALTAAPVEAYELRVLNALGQLVFRQASAAGTTQWQLPTTSFSPGLYQVQVLGASSRWAQLLLVR
ncbi:T9SS type A sorting domain-containing protein [Hymenobacter ginkgonis]|uniref:T9SS type A sorting domain-containing protein n=1 Tax=Hymenobacter ginkgonis TaxID=2682976 RepID=UPI0018DB9520|nr:T9SS type A sorting domain-containing protein [Hymenobacter ginkgonis]